MADNPPAEAAEEEDEEDEEPANNEDYERDVDDEEMYEGFSQRSLTRTIPSFASMLSGIPGRLREIQTNLKNREDITVQMVALQELSEILLMANEDSLSGNIATDQFVKELVAIMSEPDMYGSENPELMLLACRCLANLMEALPSATSNVVYGGAVPVLCQKLLEIQYIDLAEQALSVRSMCLEFLVNMQRNLNANLGLTLPRHLKRSPMNTLHLSSVKVVWPLA